VRRLDAVVVGDAQRIDAGRREQLLEHDPGAGAARPVDETKPRPAQVGEAGDLQRVAGRDDQALAARGEADQLVPARLEHRSIDPGGRRAAVRVRQRVEAGEHAAPVVERRQGVDAARELQVELERVPRRHPVAQQRQRFVVAGRDGDHGDARVEGEREGAFELAVQGGELRCEPGLRLPFGPEQPRAEGERRAGWPFDQTSSGWPSSPSQRFSSPQTWR
jgi:hypothetical protein